MAEVLEVTPAELDAFADRLGEVETYLHLDEKRTRVSELEVKSVAPGFWDDADAARATMEEPSISYRLANEIAARTGQEIRVTIPGHFQRGGSPCAYDRMLTTRFGTAAAELIANKKFGYMVAIQNNQIVPVPLSEVAGKLKTVSPNCDEIRAAKALGISMGI